MVTVLPSGEFIDTEAVPLPFCSCCVLYMLLILVQWWSHRSLIYDRVRILVNCFTVTRCSLKHCRV